MNAFGRSLRKAYEHLEKGDIARAHEALTHLKPKNTEQLLELALILSMTNSHAFNLGRKHLNRAKIIEPAIVQTELYLALDFLYKVLENQDPRIDSGLMKLINSSEDLVLFIFGRALSLSENYRRATRALKSVRLALLNDFQKRQNMSMLAQALAKLGRYLEAAQIYKEITLQFEQYDTKEETLLLAECYLQAGNAELAINNLDIDVSDVEQEKKLHYLRGVALHYLANYQDALIELKKTYLLCRDDVVSYEIYLALARVYIDLNENEKAISFYNQTLQIIPSHHKQNIRHEFARFLKEYAYYDLASQQLDELVKDARYENKVLAELDLAETAFEMYDIKKAELFVRRPYSQGLVGASLLLARIAIENFEYDDAEVYLEQVLGLSQKASQEWLTAQILLAEVFSKRRLGSPERLLTHAKNALNYLRSDDEWTLTLEGYIEEARAQTIENRVVN